MSDVAIQVEQLSKRYRIGMRGQSAFSYRALRDTLTDALAAPFRALRRVVGGAPSAPAGDETFWALRDVSFELKRGEVLGIVGRNGAGKSTLLKILSRITYPTAGRVTLHGRLGSLLEVGTGFHPELTGRENIYLNGAIMGMKKAEIDRRFDEIVAFAEIERFLDTPVKRYSSGMYVRLAFAVAAHLEPEILLVDEVLAVGDAAFQKKCLGKMDEVARAGRTILFVSHNLEATRRLCTSALHLDGGQPVAYGPTGEILDQYIRMCSSAMTSVPNVLLGDTFTGLDVLIDGQPRVGTHLWKCDTPLTLTITVHAQWAVPCPYLDIAFYRNDGMKLFAIVSNEISGTQHGMSAAWVFSTTIDLPDLNDQTLYFDVGVRPDYYGSYQMLWNRVSDLTYLADAATELITTDSILRPSVANAVAPAP